MGLDRPARNRILVVACLSTVFSCERLGFEPGGPGAGAAAGAAATTLVQVRPNVAQVYAGQNGVVVEVHFDNAGAAAAQLDAMIFDSTTSAPGTTLPTPVRPYPLALPPGASSIWAYFRVGGTTPVGPLHMNVIASVRDPLAGNITLGPAPAPAVFNVVAPTGADLADTDRDGLTDVEEAFIGSDPSGADTDFDDIEDHVEAPAGVPLDSDGDGTADYADRDSDGGGELDLLEAQHGRDPRDPADDVAFARLVVTDVSDDLDGGATLADPGAAGPTLSLREALTIAGNRPGGDHIILDAALLGGSDIPVTSASTVDEALPLISDADTIVESIGVGVNWDYITVPADDLFRTIAGRTTFYGLKISMTPSIAASWETEAGLSFETADDGIIAACTFTNDAPNGSPAGVPVSVSGSDELIVNGLHVHLTPRGFDTGFVSWSSSNVQVKRSFIEVETFGIQFNLATGGVIDDNHVRSTSDTAIYVNAAGAQISSNEVLAGDIGIDVYGGQDGHSILWNWIDESTNDGISVSDPASSRNVIRYNRFGNVGGQPIFLAPGGANNNFPPPTMSPIAGDVVSGTHPGADTTLIDIYIDVGDGEWNWAEETTVISNDFTAMLPFVLDSGMRAAAVATSASDNSSPLSTPVTAP